MRRRASTGRPRLFAEPRHGPTHKLLAEYYRKRGELGLANYHDFMASTGQEGPKAASAETAKSASGAAEPSLTAKSSAFLPSQSVHHRLLEAGNPA